jgi:hypothetical protein
MGVTTSESWCCLLEAEAVVVVVGAEGPAAAVSVAAAVDERSKGERAVVRRVALRRETPGRSKDCSEAGDGEGVSPGVPEGVLAGDPLPSVRAVRDIEGEELSPSEGGCAAFFPWARCLASRPRRKVLSCASS